MVKSREHEKQFELDDGKAPMWAPGGRDLQGWRQEDGTDRRRLCADLQRRAPGCEKESGPTSEDVCVKEQL